METRTFLLPGGYVDESGRVRREAQLRPLTGREEEYLAQGLRRETASLVTAVLSRCMTRIGDISPVSEDLARRLLIADRQYLLLKLREATFGDQVRAHLFCPWPDCGKQVSINFSIGNIPVEESTDKGPAYTLILPVEMAPGLDEDERTVTFRLPNGGDQEALSPVLAENEALALTKLLNRCILAMGRHESPDEDLVARLSPPARRAIEERMASLAPKVQLDMTVDCHECRREFVAPFDLHRFFFGEMRTSADLLYREVHYLAYHYHWGEREIMDMTRERRRKYIEVLAEEIERMNDAI